MSCSMLKPKIGDEEEALDFELVKTNIKVESDISSSPTDKIDAAGTSLQLMNEKIIDVMSTEKCCLDEDTQVLKDVDTNLKEEHPLQPVDIVDDFIAHNIVVTDKVGISVSAIEDEDTNSEVVCAQYIQSASAVVPENHSKSNGIGEGDDKAVKTEPRRSKRMKLPTYFMLPAERLRTASNIFLKQSLARKRAKTIGKISSQTKKTNIYKGRKKTFLTPVKNMDVCRKIGCQKKGLNCCIKATKNCMAVTGKTSRWYHISPEEHYCNGCFEEFYRNKNEGCEELYEWKRAWMLNSKDDTNFKNIHTYIGERQLPYWVQCKHCRQWRSLTNEIDLTPDLIQNYRCFQGNLANTIDSHESDGTKRQCRTPHIKYSCSEPQDPCVDIALDPNSLWMEVLSYTPLIKHSPAAPFLTGYYPDGVGMSCVDTTNVRQLSEFTCKPEDDDVIRLPHLQKNGNIKRKRMTGGNPYSNRGKERSVAAKNVSNAENQSTLLTCPGRRKRHYKEPPVPVEGLNPYFQPFYKPHEKGKALCIRPDVMEVDEAGEFPQYYKNQTVYLAMRNLIIALWILDPCRFLTTEKCVEHFLLRGLTRIRLCTKDLPEILRFTTRKGLVNFGAVTLPRRLSDSVSSHTTPENKEPQAPNKPKVIVIGAGPAGLAASRQLFNFGCDVTCLEARDRIGGRVHDDWSLDGVCVGRGAQIINGCVNNPLALISHQLGLKMHSLRPRCDLFAGSTESASSPTRAVSAECDKRMDFHFNALLDIIVDWKNAQGEGVMDCSLGEKILQSHHEWLNQSGLSFTELEERLLHFHVGNLEFACGASLDKVSAFHWDQNEMFAQFNGDHAFVPYGFGTQLAAIADGLDIVFNSPVRKINYIRDKVEITTVNGKILTADRALITVPLTVLRSGSIKFYPDLPRSKKEAMKRLGCGCIEKIGLQFPFRFWDKKVDGADYFGYVPSAPDKKGFFTLFYDVPYPQCEKSNVLMSVISGEAVEVARTMKERDIIDIALSILRDVFPEQNVPEPVNYFVTRWRDDEYAQMAYSYVKVGSGGEDYDELARQIDQRIFFAGEATNRHFPQTVTGAYLSGLREASKIITANNNQSKAPVNQS